MQSDNNKQFLINKNKKILYSIFKHMMPKCNVIMCWIDSDTLNEEHITQINIPPSDDFNHVKQKIELILKDSQKYEKINLDQLFYVCQEKILTEKDEMIQFKNEQLDIRVYELTSIFKQFQDQLKEIQNAKQLISEAHNEKNKLTKKISSLNLQTSNLELTLVKQQKDQENEKKKDEEKLNNLNSQINHEKLKIAELQNQKVSERKKYEEYIVKLESDIYQLGEELKKEKASYAISQGECEILQSQKENFKNQIQQEQSKILAKDYKLNEQLEINVQQKQEIASRQLQYEKLDQINQKYIQENKEIKNQYSQEQLKNQNLEETIQDINRKFEYHKKDNEIQLAQFNKTQNEQENQLSQEKQNNRDKQAQIQNLQNEINQLKNEVDQKEKEIQNVKQDLENKIQTLEQCKIQQERQIEQLTGKEQQLTQEKLQIELELKNKIKRLETKITDLEGKKEESKKQLRNIEQYLNDMNATLNSEHSEFQDQINKEKEFKGILQAKLNRLSDKFKEATNRAKIADCKIVSPTEKLFQNQQDVNNFDSGENAINNIFQVSLLSTDPKKLEKLLQKGDLGITEAIQQQNLGIWTTNKSVNASAQGTKRNLYLVRIVSEPSNKFNGKIFAMKELPNIANTKVEQAYEVASNSLISQYLLEHFKKALKGHIVHKINIPNINFQEQYLFTCEGKFFIAEPLSPDGTFKKYNGAGESNDKDRKIQMFLNAFSFYSYNFSQKQFIITNLQGIGDKLYDPIISTNEGVFMEEDLGQDEITKMLQNYKYDQKVNGKQYLESLGIKI